MDDPQPLTLFADDTGLTVDEKAKLLELEEVIQLGLQTFVDVGTALLTIRDNKLYRQKYGRFEDYCRERWGIKRQRAYELMDAAGIARNLSEISDKTDLRESHVAPLSNLEPDVQREVYSKAVETAPNGKVTAAHVQKVVNEYEAQAEEYAEEEHGYDWTEAETEDPSPDKMAVHYSSDSPEHYTPDTILDAVFECLGMIDLDPCSNSHESPHVPATNHYTIDDDGLSQVWQGSVFMNPPYGREIGKWVEKLVSEYDAGNVTEAIALVPARTDTDWFDQLIDGFRFHCFVHGRLVFIGNTESAPFPSAVVYLGTEWGRFYNAFRSFGRIVQETHPGMFGE